AGRTIACLHSTSIAVARNHAAASTAARSVRPRRRSDAPAATMSASETITWPGSVTICATAFSGGWKPACRSGTADSTSVGSFPRSVAPGIACRTAHWSIRPSEPAATSPASAAAAAATLPSRHAYPQRTGHHLEADGCRPHLLAVELDRQPLVRVHGDRARADELDLRVREVGAPVELRRRRDEIALRHVADQQDVEQAVVGPRPGREPHRAPVVLPVRDDDVVHPPLAALPGVQLHRDDRVLPLEEDADECVEEGGAPARELRH